MMHHARIVTLATVLVTVGCADERVRANAQYSLGLAYAGGVTVWYYRGVSRRMSRSTGTFSTSGDLDESDWKKV